MFANLSFKELTGALISIALVIVLFVVVLAALVRTHDPTQFALAKDVLTIAVTLVGPVTGYYLGTQFAERGAESARTEAVAARTAAETARRALEVARTEAQTARSIAERSIVLLEDRFKVLRERLTSTEESIEKRITAALEEDNSGS